MRTSTAQLVTAALLFSLLTAGCRKDDPVAVMKANPVLCFPSEIITPGPYHQLYYNKNKNISEIHTQIYPYYYSTSFTYDAAGKKIISARFLKMGLTGLFSGYGYTNSSGAYIYDSRGNLTMKDSMIQDTLYRTIYEYNSTDQLIKTTTQVTYHGTIYLLDILIYKYSETSTRNPSLVTELSGNQSVYEYDTKPNPAKVLGFPSITPDNNVTKKTFTIGVASTVSTHLFKYNSDNYPTSMTNGAATDTQWFYECTAIYK